MISSLHDVGVIIKVDWFTMLRLHVKCARVCLNIDISKPLRGFVNLSPFDLSREVPLIYEGLHEICAFWGDENHKLELFPNVPKPRPSEVVVEKFDKNKDPPSSSLNADPTQNPIASNKWVKVVPKHKIKLSPAKGIKKKNDVIPALSTDVANLVIVVDESLETPPSSGTPTQ